MSLVEGNKSSVKIIMLSVVIYMLLVYEVLFKIKKQKKRLGKG
jgi:hypothetical protein